MEEIWKTLKEKINEGIEKFIPKVKNLSFLKERNWKTPLDLNMRQNIQEKSKLWKKYKKTRDQQIYIQYKKCRNEVRRQTRNIYKLEQENIARQSKVNPKKFWNYVNSKTKNKEYVGDLESIDEQGSKTLIESDYDRAELFNKYFASVYNDADREIENIIPCCGTMEDIKIDADDIKKRLENINANKSPGPDALHPRILKELSTIINKPLKIIFELSLKEGVLPIDWRSANIAAIHKKGKKVL